MKNHKKNHKIALRRETLRQLTADRLDRVIGGIQTTGATVTCTPPPPTDHCTVSGALCPTVLGCPLGSAAAG